jgi:hypothetical protein
VSPLAAVGWSAGALLVALWLVISFMRQGRRREILEWVAATSMYVALLMLFTNLVQDAHADGSLLRLGAFGFLWLIFAGGSLVSTVNTLRSLRSAGRGPIQSATH